MRLRCLCVLIGSICVAVQIVGCCGASTISIQDLKVDNVGGAEVVLVAQLDKDLSSTEYCRHLFRFEVLAFHVTRIPEVLRGDVSAGMDMEALEKAAARHFRDSRQERIVGEVWVEGGDETRTKDSVARGIGVMRTKAKLNGSLCLYEITIPRFPRTGRLDPTMRLSEGGDYVVFMRIQGKVPTFGWPWVSSYEIDSNVRGVLCTVGK